MKGKKKAGRALILHLSQAMNSSHWCSSTPVQLASGKRLADRLEGNVCDFPYICRSSAAKRCSNKKKEVHPTEQMTWIESMLKAVWVSARYSDYIPSKAYIREALKALKVSNMSLSLSTTHIPWLSILSRDTRASYRSEMPIQARVLIGDPLPDLFRDCHPGSRRNNANLVSRMREPYSTPG